MPVAAYLLRSSYKTICSQSPLALKERQNLVSYISREIVLCCCNGVYSCDVDLQALEGKPFLSYFLLHAISFVRLYVSCRDV